MGSDINVVREHLDRLLNRFDRSFLAPDPLAPVLEREYDDADTETAALFAALFAYGRADLIQRTVEAILDAMEGHPAAFCESFDRAARWGWMRSFRYLLHTRADLIALVEGVGSVRRERGSLADAFVAGDDPAAPTVKPGIASFSTLLRERSGKGGVYFGHLVADGRKGSALKRWCLYLRWMVRRDGIDPGPWRGLVDPARLVIPLDTHVGGIARNLGLLRRSIDDWRAAEELTAFLRRLDPADPVRYDFALCSYGKLGYCVKRADPSRCPGCDLSAICRPAA